MAKLNLLTAVTMFICGSVGFAETLPYGFLIRCQFVHSDSRTPVYGVVTDDVSLAGTVLIAKNSAVHFGGSPILNRGRVEMSGDWTLVDAATSKQYKIKAQVLERQEKGREDGMIGLKADESQPGASFYLYLLNSF